MHAQAARLGQDRIARRDALAANIARASCDDCPRCSAIAGVCGSRETTELRE